MRKWLACSTAAALGAAALVLTLAAARGAAAEPAAAPQVLTLVKTVGVDPNVCASTQVITVPAGVVVTYCYEIINNTALTLTRHTLHDNRLGTLLNNFSYALAPGASAFITQSATITQTTINTATWTAYNPGPTDTHVATDTARVTVGGLVLHKTVGLDPEICATTTVISLTVPDEVTYCYEVRNGTVLALTQHTVHDSQLGTLLNNFSYALAPGASVFFTQSATITQTTVNTVTWTAYNPGPVNVISATQTARVAYLRFIWLPLIRR
jgi:hypothetical protein